MILKICHVCRTENIYFSPKNKSYICEECGESFIRPEEMLYRPVVSNEAHNADVGDGISEVISHILPEDTRIVKVFLASSTSKTVKSKREMITAAVCISNGREKSVYRG